MDFADSRLGRSLTAAAALAVLCLAPLCVTAQQVQVTLDPARTKINWTLGATLHTVEGTFALKSGTITFDRATGNASGEIIVDATSAQSGNSSRDSKMHKDVLESKRYPEITFLPKHVQGRLAEKGPSTLQVQGVFHIHGADHEMTLSVAVQTDGSTVTATSDFAVPYQAWGMKNPSTFLLKVDNSVQVKAVAAGKIETAANGK